MVREWIEKQYALVLIIALFAIFAVRMAAVRPVSFDLPPGLSRLDLTNVVAAAFMWPEDASAEFSVAYSGIQWDAFNQDAVRSMADEFGWQKDERRQFLSHAAAYTDQDYDILRGAYVPGRYEFPRGAPPAAVAAELVRRVQREHADIAVFLKAAAGPLVRANVHAMVTRALELLPDLVPYPPQNISLTHRDGRVVLVFDTTYYNIGRGNLELAADIATAGIAADVERTVFQRIYRMNGTVRTRPAGVFLWHEEHLHYHFADFIEYRLDRVDASAAKNGLRHKKSTFCIRDVSKIADERLHIQQAASAMYLVCGKERQGVSVGWGDTYFFTYPDQNFDVTNLPAGAYQLSFTVNPMDRFDEITKENNTSSAALYIDADAGIVRTSMVYPEQLPEINHIYIYIDQKLYIAP